MLSLTFEYDVDDSSRALIEKYQRQYNSAVHIAYNTLKDLKASHTEEEFPSLFDCYKQDSDCVINLKQMNNVDLILNVEWFRHCAISESYGLLKTSDKVIFGSKSNFIRRCKNLISKEEYKKKKKLLPLYSIGTSKPYKGNQKFEILDNLNVLFKPSRDCHIELKLKGVGRRVETLKKLFFKQNEKTIPITYKLSKDKIQIIYDEEKLENFEYSKIENRILGLDLNPNYIGWSVVDWKGENEFKIIDHGVYSFKKLNDLYYSQQKDKEKKQRLSNKLKNETIEVAKDIFVKALHYRCEMISIEMLKFKEGDTGKGKKVNFICRNAWLLNAFRNGIQKRCNIYGMTFREVLPEYSSVVGNILFRSLHVPDMVLASFEMTRRAYEFTQQYIKKVKDIKKNIIRPDIEKFDDFYAKSLEEFSVEGEFRDVVDLYFFLKKSKVSYRLSLDLFEINKLKFKRKSSMIYRLIYSQ